MANENLSGTLAAALNDEVVSQAFELVRTNRTGVLQTARMDTPEQVSEDNKLQWLDTQIDAIQSPLTASVNDSVTTIPVTDGSKFRVGMTVSPQGGDEVMLVTAVATNNLTVVRGFGGTTGAAIANAIPLFIDSVGREENSLAQNDGIYQPEKVFNLFQTMDTSLEFSRRALAALQFGNTNSLNFQLQEKLAQLATQMGRALVRGRRASATIGSDTHTFTGGLAFYLDQTGALKTDNSGAALTLNAIDTLNAEIVKRGGTADTIAVGINKARALNTLVKAEYSSQRLADFVSDQGGLTRLPSDLPLVGNVTQIVIDTNINDDELFIYDSTKLAIKPMAANNAADSGAWRTVDATVNGQDGERARIIGDFAMEIRQSKTHMARLHNIA